LRDYKRIIANIKQFLYDTSLLEVSQRSARAMEADVRYINGDLDELTTRNNKLLTPGLYASLTQVKSNLDRAEINLNKAIRALKSIPPKGDYITHLTNCRGFLSQALVSFTVPDL
jgi:hypothetical protein